MIKGIGYRFRRIAERISHGVVVKRRLPADFGARPVFVTPDASLRYWRPGLAYADDFLLNIVREIVISDQVVWDIGANVGLFSISAAHRVGSGGLVVALEPDVGISALIRRSLKLRGNYDLHVKVISAAVSHRCGVALFAVAARGRAASHLSVVEGSGQSGGTRREEWVPAITLDSLLDAFPPPNLVKIDVEGAEALVLSGAERLLADVRPVILCEVSGTTREQVTEIFESSQYRLFDAEQPGPRRMVVDRAVWNTLALPLDIE